MQNTDNGEEKHNQGTTHPQGNTEDKYALEEIVSGEGKRTL
jgi:hypothetical protein